jgi:hypothetical protein
VLDAVDVKTGKSHRVAAYDAFVHSPARELLCRQPAPDGQSFLPRRHPQIRPLVLTAFWLAQVVLVVFGSAENGEGAPP